MTRLLFLLCILMASATADAQNTKDTTQATDSTKKTILIRDKFYTTMYVRVMPVCIYTGAGYLKDRINQNFEVGKSFGMIDVGMAFGRNALRPDSAHNGTSYLEAKFTMDIAQYGIFQMK